MRDKWINRLFRTVAWFQALTTLHYAKQAEARMAVEVSELKTEVASLKEQMAGVAAGARQAALYAIHARKGELDAQERRVEESLRAAEGVAGAITVAGSDLSVKLREFIKQVTNDSAHYSIKQNRWYGSGFEPWSASHPDSDSDSDSDTEANADE